MRFRAGERFRSNESTRALPRVTVGLAVVGVFVAGGIGTAEAWKPFPARSIEELRARYDDGRARFAEAREAMAAGEFESAVRAFRAALAERPGHPSYLLTLASAQVAAGDPDAAFRTLGRVAELGTSVGLARFGRFEPLHDDPRWSAALDRDADIGGPRVRSRVAFTLDAANRMNEGIAFDEETGAFWISSVHQRRVVRRDPDGSEHVVIDAERHGIDGATGLEYDATHGILWVAHAAVGQVAGLAEDDVGRSGLLAFDVKREEVVARYRVPGGGPALLGDVEVAPDGSVYATDSIGGSVYRVQPDRAWLAPWIRSAMPSPQGIAFSADGSSLYVADYALGLLRIDVETRRIRGVAKHPLWALGGIDGLYRVGRDLVAIQNGFSPTRVLRLRLSRDGRRIVRFDVLESAHPDHLDPTLGVVVGKRLYYVANSQWPLFGEDGSIDEDRLRPTRILELPLRGRVR